MRLTKKFPYDEYDYCYAESNEKQNNDALVINKLGQLEDIEDEIGIDLITLFKALKQDYVYYENNEVCVRGMSTKGLIVFDEGFGWGECDYTLHWEDYGKTWSLDKNDLTKE